MTKIMPRAALGLCAICHCLTVPVWSCAADLAAAILPAAAARAADAITAEELTETVLYLADPACEGRLSGTPGYDRAADHAARRFAAAGLTPAGEDGFYQRFACESNQIESCALALVDTDGAHRAWRLGPDFVCRGFSGAGAVTGQVVFAGYGLSQPELGYDDYADLDVRGRIVLAFKDPPAWAPPAGGGADWGEAHLPRPKALAAAAHGAAALLLVGRPEHARGAAPIGSVLHGPGVHDPAFPQLHLSAAVAETLLASAGLELASLRRVIDEERQPHSRLLPATVAVAVRAMHRPAAPTMNVLARLPGRDPALARECVVVAAHLDHVGRQGQGLVFPGANDNASGAAAVLAIARALAAAAAAGADFPRRTIVFALLAGEEQGLLGAEQYAARPAVPLDRTIAMLNLDCVAHGDSLQLGNGDSAPRLWRLARALDAGGAALTVARTWSGGGADATPFHRAGVPALYFATTNSYTHLHLPSDTPATLAPDLHAEVARLACRLAAVAAMGGYEREVVAD